MYYCKQLSTLNTKWIEIELNHDILFKMWYLLVPCYKIVSIKLFKVSAKTGSDIIERLTAKRQRDHMETVAELQRDLSVISVVYYVLICSNEGILVSVHIVNISLFSYFPRSMNSYLDRLVRNSFPNSQNMMIKLKDCCRSPKVLLI